MAKFEKTPLLSLCIPTFNRAEWLRVSLYAWLSQIEKTDNMVELIVSDNNSTDQTAQVVQEAAAKFSFRYHRNPTNIGGNPNFHKCVELSRGKFVWIVGDDDLPFCDAVARVLTALQSYPEVRFFYVNQSLYVTNASPYEGCRAEDLVRATLALNPDQGDRYLDKLKDLMPGDYTCFTAIYSFIMPREEARDAFSGSIGLEPFTSVDSVSSHALYIARHCLESPAYYLGSPCLLVSSDASWPQYQSIFFLSLLPELYDHFEEAGVSRSIMDQIRRRTLSQSAYMLWQIWRGADVWGRERFNFLHFASKHWRFKEFWFLIVKVLLRAITPRPCRAVIYRYIHQRALRRMGMAIQPSTQNNNPDSHRDFTMDQVS